ncbi:MAG: RidA family protein [Bacteroidales bacterium]|nr:RidA family protein [Bacteroidales bacterium]
MTQKIKHINPDGLMKNPAFSQVITTQGNGKTIYIGGQNSVNANREIVGKGDIQAQTAQIMQNIQIALSDCNASFDNIIKLNIYIVQGQNAYMAFQTSQAFMKSTSNPPVITVLFVAGLMNPDFLIEIDATAFISE